MKFNKKKLFVAALAICLVAIISMGTLAWFTDSDDVTNKFMIAESDDDTADDIFSVDVWEKDEDGNVYDEKDNEGGITYDDILPGDKLVKDVFVENTGYYAQYIRATVTVSDGIAWANVLGKVPADVELSDIVYGLNTDGLYGIVSKYENGKLIYELYYKDALTAGKTINVFDGVKIPESMTAEQAVKFDNAFTIDVNATAVQTENVGGNVAAAFATIEGVTPVMDKVYGEPDAAVTKIDLPTVDNNGTPVELDTAYNFAVTESLDSAVSGEYNYWHADFVVTVNTDVPANELVLAGQYDSYSADWLAFTNDFDLAAGDSVRLIEYYTNGSASVNYNELCDYVKNFKCGAQSDIEGLGMTVELRLYEVTSGNVETGNYIVIGTYDYTF